MGWKYGIPILISIPPFSQFNKKMFMIVAIPKEINTIEPRVAATPSTVKDLIKSGLQVRVETLAGNDSFFSDQEYVNAGAEIVSSSSDLLSSADIILKVLPPTIEETAKLKSSATFISFKHSSYMSK